MEVRRLSDAFAEGELEKASAKVASTLNAHRHNLHTLQAFLHDNQQLTKLVQDLPHKVSHTIMVPFGKAAFFPGRLVHTNEFLVLLGEGYYAECSASRTIDILDRRGKLLGSQIAGVKSQIVDLDVESRFFSETLAEAAGGYVEIREEYVESSSSASASNMEMGGLQVPESDSTSSISRIKEVWAKSSEIGSNIEDKEHELLMARLDELEAAEAAANLGVSNPSSSGDTTYFQPPEHDCDQFVTNDRHKLGDNEVRVQALRANGPDHRGLNTDHGGSLKGRPSLQSPGDIFKFEEWRKFTSGEDNLNQTADVKVESSTPLAAQHSETETLKAFTGTVLERSAPSLPIKPSQAQAPAPKRPPSKFKMRQREDR